MNIYKNIDELVGKTPLLEIGNIIKAEGYSKLYISTDHEGLYEKYGCKFMTEAKALSGDDSRIYEKEY